MSGLTIFWIGFALVWVWILYEGWRAPMMKEQPDGTYKTIRTAKKLSELFKKNKL